MTISVKNPGRRPKTIMVIGGDTVQMTHIGTEQRADGTAAVRQRVLTLPKSITVKPGEVVSNLPDACEAEARSRGLQVSKTVVGA